MTRIVRSMFAASLMLWVSCFAAPGGLSTAPASVNDEARKIVESRGIKAGLSRREIYRILCPKGVAYYGEQARFIKPRPKEMDEWTHWHHGPDGSESSTDSLVGPSHRLQWVDGPFWPRDNGSMKAALFANGRAFNLMNEGEPRRPRWALISRDTFNGLVLWKRDLASSNPRAVIAVGKRVFTVLEKDGPLVALDAATGKVVRTYEVGVSPFIVLNIDGNLILGDKKQICSVNANTGVVNWRALADKDAPFRNADRKLQPGSDSNDKLALMVAGSGRLFVFVQDSLAPPFIGIVPFHSLAADEALGIIELLRIANAKSLCILEQARFVDELKSVHKMSISEVTRLVERSKGWVGMRVGLIGEMSKTVMDKIFSGKFPIYSYMYTIRSFMRMNGIKKEEVDEFVASVSDKGLSLRDIEMLANGYFKGGQDIREQIKSSNIAWGLSRLKHSSVEPTD